MKTRTCAAVVLWCVVGATVPGVHAQNQHPPDARSAIPPGAGRDSCGSWVSNRKSAHAMSERVAGDELTQAWVDRVAQQKWVWGFVSGASVFGPRAFDVAETAALEAWLDNYCQKSPLDSLLDATRALVLELYDRATKKGGK